MSYTEIQLVEKYQDCDDTFIFHFTYPDNFLFSPGQYVFLKNPTSKTPDEEHPFSLASSPLETQYLELGIKSFGDWTRELIQAEVGQTFLCSKAQGQFTWDTSILHAVFLVGGIGIAPIISMLRFLRDMKLRPHSLILLYGNRTPQTVAFRKELRELQQVLPMLKIVDIYSELSASDPEKGYRGFITREIVEEEVHLTLEPTFFYVGPPLFIHEMDHLLDKLAIPSDKHRKEDFAAITHQGFNP